MFRDIRYHVTQAQIFASAGHALTQSVQRQRKSNERILECLRNPTSPESACEASENDRLERRRIFRGSNFTSPARITRRRVLDEQRKKHEDGARKAEAKHRSVGLGTVQEKKKRQQKRRGRIYGVRCQGDQIIGTESSRRT